MPKRNHLNYSHVYICCGCGSVLTINLEHPHIANGDWQIGNDNPKIYKYKNCNCPVCGAFMFQPETLKDQYTDEFIQRNPNYGKRFSDE
jgi:hypothetical protein